MAMSADMKIDDSKYDLTQLDRPTTAPSYNSSTVIKYLAPRTLGLNLSNSFQGSLRNFNLSNTGSSFATSPVTTSHGLVSLIQSSTFSNMSSIQSIDGDRVINEHRELSQLNETLSETILRCCNVDAHNRAQELQFEWLKTHANKNSSTIEKMFRTEIQTAQQLIDDTTRHKSDLEKKLNDIHQTTLANDEHYQQLLSKRNAASKEIFDYQRQLAQNRAEIEFLRYRIQYFNDEVQFYTLKNGVLEARQVKLHYELDEETFAKQVLHMELEVLENEKITNEDMHLTFIDDVRGSVDITQIPSLQPSIYYRDQLHHQLRHMRLEYEKKLQTYRDELHRKLDLEFHRYKMYKSRPIPNVTREHEQKLEQHKRERKDIDQQNVSVRVQVHEIQRQIETLEKHIDEENINTQSTEKSHRHLTMLEQIIRERERQLNDAIRVRTSLKQQIESYRENVNRYSTRLTQNSYETEQPSVSKPIKSILRSTSQEVKFETNRQEQSLLNMVQPIPSAVHSEQTEGTLVRATDFDVEQDCDELNKIFNESNIDQVAVIIMLCNRSIGQRLQIRDTYKKLFGQNLDNVIETGITGNSKKILRILLLSPIEYDCFELHRVLKGTSIDENMLIEIFLSRSNKQIKSIINIYSKLFNSTLEQDIVSDRNEPSIQIFVALLQANRPEDDDHIDNDTISDDARNLYETNSKWRTDGSAFIPLLCNRSNEHLKQIFAAYQQFSRVDIEQFIKMDTDGDLSRTLMAIVRIARNQPRFFAYELRKSLKGSSTNEDNLTRIIISRCEIDMVQIKSEYEKVAKRTLYDQIQTDTNGDYKRVLLELLRQRIEPINKELLFKQFLEPPELPKKTRPTVQWQEPINKQFFGKSLSNQNIDEIKPFDRNNKAKSNSLLTINTRPSKSQYIDRRRFHSNKNQDE